MLERHEDQPESCPQESANQRETTRHLQQEALSLYQCNDGLLIHNPLSSLPTLGSLPALELTDTQLAGRTFRRGQTGWTTDGGKVELS